VAGAVFYRFQDCHLDLTRGCLFAAEQEVQLRPKSYEVLRYLVENAGRLISKEELIAAVWLQAVVTDESIARCISEVRAAIGDRDQTTIKTVPRRGYLFTADVMHQTSHESVEHPEEPASAMPDSPSIAVLAFDNLSSDPEQEYFADGMVEEIITAMSRVRWLFVIARQSSFAYKGRAVDIRRIGQELGVRYVVEGSVRKGGEKVRITVQLIEAATGAHIWARRYERELRDIFALQDEITESAVSAIEPNVRAVETKRAMAKPTENLEAYDVYLRALPELHALTVEGAKRGESLLRKAIELDPNYAEALGALADFVTAATLNGWHKDLMRGGKEACELAHRAIASDPQNGVCLAAAASAYALLAQRFDQGLQFAERAILLHPNSVFVRNRCGVVFAHSGESDKAIAQFEAAQRMNPRDPSSFTTIGMAVAHFFARRFEECIHWGRLALRQSLRANIARRYVAAALAHLGQVDEARSEIAELLKYQPNSSLARSRQSSYRYKWMYDLYLDGLRKAGLPEV
jgi:adenylate cyclase